MNRKKRSGRFLSVFLSMLLAVSLALPGMPAAFAESRDAEQEGGAGSKALSAQKDMGMRPATFRLGEAFSGNDGGSEEKDPMEDTVIVLMEDDSLTTKKKVRNVLSAGDEAVSDITVEEVWDFNTDKKGLSLNGEGKGEQDDAVVALVSSDSISAGSLVKKLNKRKDVAAAEKNVKVHSLSVTDDPYSDYQWSMQSNENTPNVEYEWKEKGTTGTDKIVAVVDSGVDYSHPDLKENMWVNTHKQIKGEHGFDFVNGDPDPMDDNGHGTHCAGIIGAVGNNKEGISGVNQKVRIMAMKTLDSEGSSWLSHEVAAYNYINKAIDLGEPVVAINNSWGGGADSIIFAKLIDIIGQKGAATICAAGNSGVSNDDEPEYPADIDSPYLIDVAATDRSGELADFSNYGESVDIAAPGSDILSTVSYESYNPAIYGAAQDSISAKYNSYDDDANTFAVPDTFYVNGDECEKDGDVFKGKDGQEIRVQKADEGAMPGDEHSLEISYTGLKDDDLVSFTLPYEVEEGAKIYPYASLMAKLTGPDNVVNGFAQSLLVLLETSADAKLDYDTISELSLSGTFFSSGESRRWSHLGFSSLDQPQAGDKRMFAITVYSAKGGDYSIKLDDVGMSRQDIETEAFGKYDFMSGTSMATPFISGAVALKAAEAEKKLKEGETLNISDVLSEVTAMAKAEPQLPVGPQGAFDFRVAPTVIPPRIGKVTVDTEADTLKISGSGLFYDRPGFKVELGEDSGSMREAEIIPGNGTVDGREVLIKNDHWINNVEDVRVTGADGKISRKRGLYLVSGKKEYKTRDDLGIDFSTESMCTDGKKIYSTWSNNCEIRVQDPSKKNEYADTFVTITPSKYFKVEKDENVKYGMLFGSGLVYANGKLYNVIEYGAAEEIEASDDFWIEFGAGKKASGQKKDDKNDDDDGVDEFDGSYAIYAGEYKLISIDTKSKSGNDKAVTDLGKLPEELEELDDYTMAAYFGKIYFIGGSRGYGETKVLSDKVFVFDPATKKWSEGPALPEPRAAGQALQYGSQLIYTLGDAPGIVQYPGYGVQNIQLPDNLMFDGKTWRACSVPDGLVKMYGVDVLNVGLTAKGLIYSGAPVCDYGDTFIYDVSANKYVDTGYNYLLNPDNWGPATIAVGGTLYGTLEDESYTIPIESGLAKVSAKKKGKGKITGTGGYLPGNNAKITVKAAKKYYIKSLKVNGKKIKLSKKPSKKVYTIKKITEAQKVQVVFAKK